MVHRVELVGVPTNSAGDRLGVARGPAALRERGLVARLAVSGDITDAGDASLPEPERLRGASGILAERALVAMIETVRDTTRGIRRRGRFPLLLGGDCPVMLGALAGLQAETERVGLLFVDGHEDAWPPYTSPTGEAADSELGLSLRLFDDMDPALGEVLPTLRPSDVVAIGPRDHDELAAAHVPSLADLVRMMLRPEHLPAVGLAGVVRSAIETLPRPWWLHVDLDVLATSQLSAVDYPQAGGLSWDQLLEITCTALAHDGCAGWSVCIYNPDLDPDRAGADRIIQYVVEAVAAARASTATKPRQPSP